MTSSNGASTPQQLGEYICNTNPYTRKRIPRLPCQLQWISGWQRPKWTTGVMSGRIAP